MDLQTAVAVSLLPAGRARVSALFKPCRGPPSGALSAVIASSGLPSREADVARSSADALLRAGSRSGIEPIPWFDARYPALLDCIRDPPPVLWIRGNAALFAR